MHHFDDDGDGKISSREFLKAFDVCGCGPLKRCPRH